MFNQKGFTLIELVSVMVIMGVLASVTIKKFDLVSGNAEIRAIEAAPGLTCELVRSPQFRHGFLASPRTVIGSHLFFDM